MSASGDALRSAAREAVRQTQQVLALDARKRPADRSKPVIAVLNDRWRVIDDGIQWILQKRKGRPAPKSTGWRARGYATTRASLLDTVERKCEPVDPGGLRILRALPDEHRSREESRHDR